MATRRTLSSRVPTSPREVIRSARRRSTRGTNRSFETMMASATDSTITIAVAAERPPMKATNASKPFPDDSGSASTNMSLSALPAGKRIRPATAIGITNRLMRTR